MKECAESQLRPTFSVVVPLFQKRHRVRECLESIRNQSYAPYEVIVIDDGSTDGGGEIANEVGAGWIRYFRQENQGVSSARNHGIALAEGSYVAFLDADDTWRKQHLASMAQLALSYPEATILGTGWTEKGAPVNDPELVSDETKVTLNFFLERGARGHHLYATPAVVAKMSCVSGRELFPVGCRIAEDQDAWIQLLELGLGIRSQEVTVDVFDDRVNPTMTIPKPADFESVIFKKWSDDLPFKSKAFANFVAAHRIFTIQRHIGYAPYGYLLKLLVETKPGVLSIRGLNVLLRMFLQAIGLLKILRTLRNSRQT